MQHVKDKESITTTHNQDTNHKWSTLFTYKQWLYMAKHEGSEDRKRPQRLSIISSWEQILHPGHVLKHKIPHIGTGIHTKVLQQLITTPTIK